MATEVLFRKCCGETVAVFPYEPFDLKGSMTCYAQIGQHHACSIAWYPTSKAAKPEDYQGLLEELRRVGYDDLKIIKRINYRRMNEAMQSVRGSYV